MWQFENKKTTEMKASNNEVHAKDEGFRKKTFSRRSLAAISLHSTGRELGDGVSQWLSLNLKEDIKNLLNEAGKYMRRIRDHQVCLSHVQQAVRMDDNLPTDVFFRLILREDFSRPLAVKGRTAIGAPTSEPCTVQLFSDLESQAEISLEPAPSLHSGWLKLEQVLLKDCKRYPLTKEQQSFYELITEACVGSSESRRQRALQTLSTDPSLEVLLPTLSEFIADSVVVNVTQQNLSLLLYLMRMVRALLGNSRLSLLQYLHQILPAVLSCLLTKQACPSPGLEDHWALREYSGNIMAQIVRHFDAADNSILPRVIGIYKSALCMQPLTTVFGAVIGLGKMGNHVVRSCILPQIAYLSGRIEPHLTVNGCSSSSLDKLAAKYIRHRVVKICTKVLKNIPDAADLPEQFAVAYGFLGPSLCESIIVERIKVEVMAAAKAETEEASRMQQAKTTSELHKNPTAFISTNQMPSNGVRRTNDIPQSGSNFPPTNGLTGKVPPRISYSPMSHLNMHSITGKPVDCVVSQPAQVPMPQFRNNLIPPTSKHSFSPASNGILPKSNNLFVLPPNKNGFVPPSSNNGRKPINYLLK
ncbi:transcription initiation factor TFIID subunit 6 [Drosophila rhopaloa]|uniref:Transcription initiation factor TFIID subunit 6 n=1 Tax=Drosophila rhopaloa TaxID=1041015 RepID=A0A6P4EAR7_DRORH|nr:transcription initiation factor TFIID subunit 6 [Drosophila rhopaloa]